MVRVLVVFIFILMAELSSAQDYYINLECSPITVEEGEPFTVFIKYNTDNDLEYNFPDELKIAGGVESGIRSSIDYASKQAIRYSYQKMIAVFEEAGEYTIGPIIGKSPNGEISSKKINLTVKEPVNLISANPENNLGEPFFGIIEQSKVEIYEGEPFILSSKLYAQGNLVSLIDYESFSFDGPSEVHLLQNQKSFKRDIERVKDKDLDVFSGGRTLVFPEKSGEYTINPFKMLISFKVGQYNQFDRKIINSNKTSIRVKPLPNNVPSNFIGAVGQFDVSCKASNKKLKVGDVFEYVVRVKGKGNLHNIDAPQLKLPKGLSLYGDPEVQDSVFFTSNGAEGSITYTYNIQVLKGGNYTLDNLEIAYFNPETEVYENKKANSIQLRVKGSTEIKIPEKKESKKQPKEQKLKTILVDVRRENEGDQNIFNTAIFWTGIGTPLSLAFVFGFFFKHRKENEKEIVLNAQRKKAKQEADFLLQNAQQKISEAIFYEQISNALFVFLAHKLNIDKATITRSFIKSLKLDEIYKHKMIEILDKCDEARFGFSSTHENKEEILQNTQSLINELNDLL